MKKNLERIIREELSEIKYEKTFADESESLKKFTFLKNKIDDDNENFEYQINIPPYQTKVFNYFDSILVCLYEEGELFLIIQLAMFKDGVKITDLRSLRKKTGIGIKLYNELAKTFGSLYSDTLQYEASKRIWDKIRKEFPERVVAYNRMTREEVPLDDNLVYPEDGNEDIILKLKS